MTTEPVARTVGFKPGERNVFFHLFSSRGSDMGKDRNNRSKGADWPFSTADARVEPKHLYPKPQQLHGTG